jgi:hypothetical protein
MNSIDKILGVQYINPLIFFSIFLNKQIVVFKPYYFKFEL